MERGRPWSPPTHAVPTPGIQFTSRDIQHANETVIKELSLVWPRRNNLASVPAGGGGGGASAAPLLSCCWGGKGYFAARAVLRLHAEEHQKHLEGSAALG